MTARLDRVSDPAIKADLLLARRGQAYFSRVLGQLHDETFDVETTHPGVSRRNVIIEVGLQARLLANQINYLATGVLDPERHPLETPDQWNSALAFGATLPPIALRNLNSHAAIHLNVEWRDLAHESWIASLSDRHGQDFPVASTPWLRAKQVWLGAIALQGGQRWDELPSEMRLRLQIEDHQH